MAYERLRNSGLTQALTDLLGDLGDLVQKEIQLAKAEVTEKITSRLRASVWMVAAAFMGFIAILAGRGSRRLRACEPGAGASLGVFTGGCRIRRRRGGHVLSRPFRGGD